MRCDKPIYFQKSVRGPYNRETGNYEPPTITETKVYASVTDSSAETLNLVYGKIKQRTLTIRLQTQYNEPFDRIRIGDKLYGVDKARNLRTKQVFVVSEVQKNAKN